MIYRSPQLVDDLILGSVKNRAGTTANDVSPTLAAHSVRQNAATDQVQNAQRSLGLARENLGLNRDRLSAAKNQFNQNLGLARSDLKYNQRAGNTAAVLSGLGLGVSALGDMAARKRAQQQLDMRNSMIKDLENEGTQTSKYWSRILQLI